MLKKKGWLEGENNGRNLCISFRLIEVNIIVVPLCGVLSLKLLRLFTFYPSSNDFPCIIKFDSDSPASRAGRRDYREKRRKGKRKRGENYKKTCHQEMKYRSSNRWLYKLLHRERCRKPWRGNTKRKWLKFVNYSAKIVDKLDYDELLPTDEVCDSARRMNRKPCSGREYYNWVGRRWMVFAYVGGGGVFRFRHSLHWYF